MARVRNRGSILERSLATLGLFLLGVTGWAVERPRSGTPMTRLMARLVLGCVTAVGRLIDRLPPPRADRRALQPPSAHGFRDKVTLRAGQP